MYKVAQYTIYVYFVYISCLFTYFQVIWISASQINIDLVGKLEADHLVIST